jgi:hypothetical protein
MVGRYGVLSGPCISSRSGLCTFDPDDAPHFAPFVFAAGKASV